MVLGLNKAREIEDKLHREHIYDIQIMYDPTVKPLGMWVVVQVQKHSSSILLPGHYHEKSIKPYILWWCKTNDGLFREPNDEDLYNIIAVVRNAKAGWKEDATGKSMADRLDAKDEDKRIKGKEKLSKRIKAIAPEMKKAIQRELT